MWCYQVGRGVPHLSSLTSLTSLNLRNTSGLSLQGLHTIGGLSTLRHLDMRGACYLAPEATFFWEQEPLAEGVMSILSKLVNLELLDLKNTYCLVTSPTDAELASLACLTSLQTLRVGLILEEEYDFQTHQHEFSVNGSITATAAGVEALRTLTALKQVDLTGYFDDELKETLEKTAPSLAAKCIWCDLDRW
jgi:hypothetical protein